MQILELLQQRGGMSYQEIGEKVNLSITAVKERKKKLLTTILNELSFSTRMVDSRNIKSNQVSRLTDHSHSRFY